MSISTHIGLQHAAYTADESVWVNFYGAVPRAGDTVYLDGRPFAVVRVTWHVASWDYKSRELGRAGPKEVRLSQARILVEPAQRPQIAAHP